MYRELCAWWVLFQICIVKLNPFQTEGVDSADWTGTYGVTETNNGHGITLKFVTHGEYSSNVGSRSYLLAPDEENYYMFYLPNKEFTFDVDVSQLPCYDDANKFNDDDDDEDVDIVLIMVSQGVYL